MTQYWQEHAVASGFDNAAGYTNFEDYFAAPLFGDRVPRGAVQQDALDGSRVYDGDRRVFLRTAGGEFTELDAYVQAVFSGWDGEDTVEVTLRCQQQDDTYADFNAFAYLPVDGQHFQRLPMAQVSDIELEFLILNETT